MVEAITAMANILSQLEALGSAASAPADPGRGGGVTASSQGLFSDLLSDAVNRLDGDIASANAKARGFAAGDDIPLSDVMLALEQANLGLQTAANVRDKVVAAYSNIMSMPL
jgi:flagellar hook-basal body complex protein FliE